MSYYGGGLTGPQRQVLAMAIGSDPAPLRVRGGYRAVAERLDRLGLVKLRIGGSGKAWTAPWWYEIVPTEEGREKARSQRW